MINFFTHKFRKKSPIEVAGIIIFGIIAIAALAILFGFVIMWLWNWLMPEIFGLMALTYWQAVGLFVLLKLLLGGCGSGSHSKKSSKNARNECKEGSKTDFSKWKHYDKFWKEEGDEYYAQFVERQSNQTQESPSNSASE